MCEIRLNIYRSLVVSNNLKTKLPSQNFGRHHKLLVATLRKHKVITSKTTHTHTHNAPVRKLSLGHFLKLNCLYLTHEGLVLGPYALKLH